MNPEEQKQIDGAPPQSDAIASTSPGGASKSEATAGTRRDPSASRRRLLIRGLVGGPVALAAMRPVKSFAAKKYCQYSGWASFKVNPKTSAHPKQKCTTGKKASRYNGSGWPSSILATPGTSGSKNVTLSESSTEFKTLFGGTDSTKLKSYLSGGTTNQSTFICALFNAKQVSGYPFTIAEVYSIWATPSKLGKGVTLSGAALFFQQLDVT